MERFLAVDLGNSRLKATLFSEGKVTESAIMTADDIDPLLALVDNHGVEAIAMVAVGHVDVRLVETLRNVADGRFILLSSALPMPVDLSVYRKGALGLDRAAALCGTASLFPGRYCVVVDAGTALTIDHLAPDVSQPRFLGGTISPGVRMRLDALHSGTALLPAVEPAVGLLSLNPSRTDAAMVSGALLGVVGELEVALHAAPAGSKVVITGGDADLILKSVFTCGSDALRDASSVSPDLVALGLLNVFDYNAENL